MLTGRHIETARIHAGIPVYIMCTALDLPGENEYKFLVYKNRKPTVYQQIMLVTLFEYHPESMPSLCV